MDNWPNLFIVGAAKAGTTALHSLLSGHPDIAMSSVKEPHYYTNLRIDPAMRHLIKPVRDESSYLSLFRKPADARVRGEASPSYLFDPQSAARIREDSPDAKIIILLRDPVDRAYSHYLMDVREGIQPMPFPEALAADDRITDRRWGSACHLYTDLGMYASQVRRYLDVFPREQVLVLESALLQAQDAETLRSIATFLEVDARPLLAPIAESGANSFAQPRSNLARRIMGHQGLRTAAQRLVPQRARRVVRDQLLLSKSNQPPLDAETRKSLQDRFGPDVTDTRAIVGEPLASLTARWI